MFRVVRTIAYSIAEIDGEALVRHRPPG